MDRIEKLRTEALNKRANYDEFHLNFYEYYLANENSVFEERYAEAFYHAFLNLTPQISAGELIAGKCKDVLTPENRKKWEEQVYPLAMEISRKAGGGQDSHMAVDYELLLSSGLSGIAKKAETLAENSDEDKKRFYRAVVRCIEGVIKHSENYAKEARKLAEEEKDDVRKGELLRLSETMMKVPKNPAESFYEALQSVHFVTYALSMDPFRLNMQQFQLGHIDRYLYPYYTEDIKSGKITKEEAQILLDCLGIQINNRVPNGLSSGYMLGGKDENGNAVGNELTMMSMQVIEDIRLVYPAVGLCCTDDMEENFIDKATELLLKGFSHPAFFNDEVITKGLTSYGVPEKEARNYIHSTCVEITPVASSNVWVASPYTNMPAILLSLMDREYDSFDELLKAYYEKIDEAIKANYEAQKHMRKVRKENSFKPFLSCLVNDCLDKGTDIEKGGARYNFIMPSFVGMANLVDSLFALKKMVFEKKEMTMSGMKKLLDENFEGNEEKRLKLLLKIPKYGNDTDEVDYLFNELTEHLVSECEKYGDKAENERLIPSVFCWIMHDIFGRETGATPDGRCAGFPLGDGSGPCQGREMKGPTASILSATKWEHQEFIGGVAVNMKFSKSSLGTNSKDNVKSLVKVFLQRGGFELQINVVDKETLLKARENPEAYRDLVVRIGGYSDYFTRLSESMQNEVILRTEHKI